MVSQTLKVVSRASRLAHTQTLEALEQLRAAFPGGVHFDLELLTSPGDRDLATPLTDARLPTDFFTRDLDQRLLSGEARLAVHSAKDLPVPLTPGLALAALLPALDVRDALVIRNGLEVSDVRVIGTSSPRRESEIIKIFPNATLKPLRGAIDQRIAKLDAGEYDAIIVAACALLRLGLADRIHQHLPYPPAPNQGRLAITVREQDTELLNALRPLDVLHNSGLVAIVAAARAKPYLEQADVIFHARPIPSNIATRGSRVEIAEAAPQSEINRRMLHEAEKGNFVAQLTEGRPASDALDFFNAWSLRCEIAGDAETLASTRATLFTGTRPEHFLRHGPLIHFPLLELAARPLAERAADLNKFLPGARGVIFPSPMSARSVAETGISLSNKMLLAIGPATADELRQRGLLVEVAADDFGGVASLAKKLGSKLSGRFLYPCSDAAPQPDRIAALRECGIELLPIIFYENRERPRAELPKRAFTRVLFTSPSTVRAYFTQHPEEQRRDRTWLAVGPSTQRAIEALGLRAEALKS